ncbi:MAG: CHAD domain-containing protein [Nitrososphaerales archaeon]
MKPEPVSPTRFQNALAAAQARTERAVQACIKRPTPEAIHEARISVRKLMTAISLMPKGFRRDYETVKTTKALRLFYTACAKIRDIDAMTRTLSTGTVFSDLKNVVADLKKRRSVLLARALSSGGGVTRLALPKPTEDTRRRLRRRLNKLLNERAERARDLYWIAASGEEKVAELHTLRKECRRIMYLLEFANEDAKVKSVKADLEEAREKLGSMRDDDVLLDVLRGAREDTYVEAAAAVSTGRRAKYKLFFSGQTDQGNRPRLLEGILSLT